MILASAYKVLATGIRGPEGPAFRGVDELLFVDWETSAINCASVAGGLSELARTGGIPAGLAVHRNGLLYIADEGSELHGILVMSREGLLEVVVQAYEGVALNGANDLAFSHEGDLYFSDPWGSSVDRPIGAFYRLRRDGRLELLDTGLAFPNGVAITSDGATVYLAETLHNRVLRYAIDARGKVSERAVFATLAGEPGPDGMVLDEEGRLYVAHVGAGTIDVFDANGQQVERLPAPGRLPTNLAFGGLDRHTLVVTEAETASVYEARTSVRGQALFGDSPD